MARNISHGHFMDISLFQCSIQIMKCKTIWLFVYIL